MNLEPGMNQETVTQILLKRLDEIGKTLARMEADAAQAAIAAAIARDTVAEMASQVKKIVTRLETVEGRE